MKRILGVKLTDQQKQALRKAEDGIRKTNIRMSDARETSIKDFLQGPLGEPWAGKEQGDEEAAIKIPLNDTAAKICMICDELAEFLCQKNQNYGNSALEPVRIFSKGSTADNLDVRIDDKLSRIRNSDQLRKNDVVDLLGYLVLRCIERDWLEFGELID